ncbi:MULTISPECIES: cell wall synthase accessory phosphoprotein MacP [unclassified Streptococcus]|uniref:cell wall synthase accessory phosphoprotein MacP n=1 Tax=unclassified Streptococcus TaxID=2608887 RepID=UPI0018CBC834|nr:MULTISPECIES: cell wall synthase accessory phosphoprotein MacP [unclassified Streptococcus]MBG9368023.1 hypothetical protein [Streptococcus sp. NLN64]MBJ6744957.1 hypothetical protein [Streptococcus sp. 121]
MTDRQPFDPELYEETEPLDLDLLNKIDRLEVEPEVRKSRQAENQKRARFQHTLNKILFWLILLLVLLLIFMFVL